jgi:hypothetical protein
VLEAVCETEIRDDDVPVFIEKQVLQFKVPMNNFLLVDVPNSRDELRKQFGCVSFTQVPVGQDVVEELATGRVFDDNPNVLVSLDNIVQTDDVRMLEVLYRIRASVRLMMMERVIRSMEGEESKNRKSIRKELPLY